MREVWAEEEAGMEVDTVVAQTTDIKEEPHPTDNPWDITLMDQEDTNSRSDISNSQVWVAAWVAAWVVVVVAAVVG